MLSKIEIKLKKLRQLDNNVWLGENLNRMRGENPILEKETFMNLMRIVRDHEKRVIQLEKKRNEL